jgi:hypothetical protein
MRTSIEDSRTCLIDSSGRANFRFDASDGIHQTPVSPHLSSPPVTNSFNLDLEETFSPVPHEGLLATSDYQKDVTDLELESSIEPSYPTMPSSSSITFRYPSTSDTYETWRDSRQSNPSFTSYPQREASNFAGHNAYTGQNVQSEL